MSSRFVLASRFPLVPQVSKEVAASLSSNDRVSHYFDFEGQELLQFRAYDDLSEFSAGSEELGADVEGLRQYMAADVIRELLEFVEAPKPCAGRLPNTDYVQLRHVEVPPSMYSDYRQWRASTIFQAVRDSTAIEVFLAYHSIVSGQPGVMFIAGFSGDPVEYQAVFETERYRDIVRQAGSKYISGGTGGLYTRLYARVGS
ncbi:hypothetical protein NG726_16910 [Pseudomonas sp. MOB-449]|nr:hypothetical protein [Pseudomonas sp. MOB-449]